MDTEARGAGGADSGPSLTHGAALPFSALGEGTTKIFTKEGGGEHVLLQDMDLMTFVSMSTTLKGRNLARKFGCRASTLPAARGSQPAASCSQPCAVTTGSSASARARRHVAGLRAQWRGLARAGMRQAHPRASG